MRETLKRIYAILLAFFMSLMPLQPLTIEPGAHEMCYDSEEANDYLNYWLHIPNGATENMPLIVFLHGDGEINNMSGLKHYGIYQAVQEIYGDDYPFILLMPNTRQYSWIKPNIQQTLKELIDYVVEEYKIDKEHIIITGHSRGAIGTWYMISQYGDYFSCAVPVSCDYELEDFVITQAITVPVQAYVGGGSDYRNYAKNMTALVDQINEAGGEASLIVLEGKEHWQTSYAAYTLETFEWMLAQGED